MSSKYMLALVAGIAVVVGVVIATQWERDRPTAVAAHPVPALPSATPEATTSPAPRSIAPPPSAPAARAAATPPAGFVSAYEAQFKEATDYLEFAHGMLPKARAGDHDAQFHLFSALAYCRKRYSAYFYQGQQRRTLEEALRLAANGPSGGAQEISKVHSRCHALMESDVDELGEPQQWLLSAATAKHPRAQAELAVMLAARSQQLPGERGARFRTEALALARESLASRDPAVIWKMGDLTSPRADAASRDDPDVMAFARAACDRGLDCSAGSEPAAQWCLLVPNCQPFESVQDLLLRASENPAALEDRAKRINELIDAGDWRALGFADPTPGQ